MCGCYIIKSPVIKEVQSCSGHINLKKSSAQKSMVFVKGCQPEMAARFLPAVAQKAERNCLHSMGFARLGISGLGLGISGLGMRRYPEVLVFWFIIPVSYYEIYNIAEKEL